MTRSRRCSGCATTSPRSAATPTGSRCSGSPRARRRCWRCWPARPPTGLFGRAIAQSPALPLIADTAHPCRAGRPVAGRPRRAPRRAQGVAAAHPAPRGGDAATAQCRELADAGLRTDLRHRSAAAPSDRRRAGRCGCAGAADRRDQQPRGVDVRLVQTADAADHHAAASTPTSRVATPPPRTGCSPPTPVTRAAARWWRSGPTPCSGRRRGRSPTPTAPRRPPTCYRFDHATWTLRALGLGATHGSEIVHIHHSYGSYLGRKLHPFGRRVQPSVGRRMQRAWLDFAAGGQAVTGRCTGYRSGPPDSSTPHAT